MTTRILMLALGATLAAGPMAAQPNATASSAAVEAGVYRIDPNHTQVIWSVDHMGFSRLYGMAGQMTGTLQIDPAHPDAAVLQVEIPMSGLTVTAEAFGKHLQTPDLFDTAKFPTGRFVSRSVAVKGRTATITGDLTLHGVTRPVVLNAVLYGAGPHPKKKIPTVGFSAKAQLKRSEFGLGYSIPSVSDTVDLEITAAFEKP